MSSSSQDNPEPQGIQFETELERELYLLLLEAAGYVEGTAKQLEFTNERGPAMLHDRIRHVIYREARRLAQLKGEAK